MRPAYTFAMILANMVTLGKRVGRIFMEELSQSGLNVDLQKKIIGLIKVIAPEAAIYLYGSRARGDYRDYSDIDIALDAGKPLDRLVLIEIKDVLEAMHMVMKCDVVDLHNISEDLRAEIKKEGALWSR
jgi:predicted nucleotidyltransferase